MHCCNFRVILKFVFQLFLLCLNNSFVVMSELQVNLLNVTGVHNPSTMQHFKLSMEEYDGHQTMHLEFEFRKSVSSFKMRIKLQMPRREFLPATSLNTIMDGCKVLNGTRSSNRVTHILLSLLQRGTGIIPAKCPMEANKRFIVDRFYLPADIFYPFTPEMLVIANFTMVAQNKMLYSLLLTIEFLRK